MTLPHTSPLCFPPRSPPVAARRWWSCLPCDVASHLTPLLSPPVPSCGGPQVVELQRRAAGLPELRERHAALLRDAAAVTLLRRDVELLELQASLARDLSLAPGSPGAAAGALLSKSLHLGGTSAGPEPAQRACPLMRCADARAGLFVGATGNPRRRYRYARRAAGVVRGQGTRRLGQGGCSVRPGVPLRGAACGRLALCCLPPNAQARRAWGRWTARPRAPLAAAPRRAPPRRSWRRPTASRWPPSRRATPATPTARRPRTNRRGRRRPPPGTARAAAAAAAAWARRWRRCLVGCGAPRRRRLGSRRRTTPWRRAWPS